MPGKGVKGQGHRLFSTLRNKVESFYKWRDSHILSSCFSDRFREEFEKRDEHRKTESTDQNVKDSGDIAQRQSALRRTALKKTTD